MENKESDLHQEKLAVRIFREQLGLTRLQVSNRVGITERTLAAIESGKAVPKLKNLLALTRVYNKSLKEMVRAIGLDTSGIPNDE